MEELSFGDDRREPESRTGLLRKPLAVAGLVVVLLGGLAGLGLAGWRIYEHSRWPLPPPETPAPLTGRLSVFLCVDGSDEYAPNCRYGAATADGKRAIEAALRSLPPIRGFFFETKEQAYEKFRRSAGEDPAGKAAVLDRIRDLDGVKAVYVEDAAHARVNRRRIFWRPDTEDVDVRALPEAFYIALDRPPAKTEMEKIFLPMPGVAQVVPVS